MASLLLDARCVAVEAERLISSVLLTLADYGLGRDVKQRSARSNATAPHPARTPGQSEEPSPDVDLTIYLPERN